MMRQKLSIATVVLCGALGFSQAAQAQQTGQDTGNFGQTNGSTATSADQTGGINGDINQQFEQATQTGLQENLGAADAIFTDTRNEGGFIGASSENQTNNLFSRAGEVGGGGNRTLDFLRALGTLNQNAGEARTTQRRRTLRAPLRLGFTVTKPADEVVASSFESRLLQLPVYKDHASVVATLENRILTLEGTVQTQDERKMVERLALLEPGVSRVNNQLSVVSADQ